MAKYEIMLIIDPKEDFKNVEKLTNEVFDKPKIKKLEQTELAYEINKSKTAHYVLINVETNGDKIKEFTRKVNISKKIWRILIINLDTEIGREKSIELIEKRKQKLAKDREEYLKQKETRIRESNEKETTDDKSNKEEK